MQKISGKLAFFAITILLSAACEPHADTPPSAEPKWFACETLAECMVIDGVCDWAAVNGQYALEARQFFDAIAPAVECQAGGYAEPKPEAVCVAQKCALKK